VDVFALRDTLVADYEPETSVEPRDIVMGMRVRHRSRGAGTVLSVKPIGKSAELLIRFGTSGEAWMVFGPGHLELQASSGPKG